MRSTEATIEREYAKQFGIEGVTLKGNLFFFYPFFFFLQIHR